MAEVLVSVTAYTHGKDYILWEFEKMMDRIVHESKHDVVILWASDCQEPKLLKPEHVLHGSAGCVYADDMLAESRSFALGYAQDIDADFLIWHGVDALYQFAHDFDRLIDAAKKDIVVSPLISARTESGKAVARRFIRHDNRLLRQQVDVPDWELRSGTLIPTGFPGADNMVIGSDWFPLDVTNYKPWYEKVRDGEPNTCYEEDWVYEMERQGGQAYVHTGINVWHVHDDGVARLWPDREATVEEISWWDD
jgi:hypothetical protein